MTEPEKECELQQLVSTEEDQSTSGRFEVTPPISPGISKITQTSPTSPASNKDVSSSYGGGSIKGAVSQASSSSRSISRIATVPSLSSASGGGTKHIYVNERGNVRPPRPSHPPPSARLKRDVTDVRRMETALLTLLEDFHSGKLRAFGKDCRMEEMTGIREQQERLARLHFELGAKQDLYQPLSEEGLSQGKENMHQLMTSLEKLSESIEKLHTFSSQPSYSTQPDFHHS